METIEVGVRAKKSARIKVDILIASTQLVGKKSFTELYVDDICDRVGISKVTFFKYFPQKDHILLYFLRTWCLDRAVELYHNPKEGIDGILYLFDKVADTFERNPGLMLSLVSYFTSLTRPPSPFPLKPVERRILYPNEIYLDKIQIMSIPQMMEKFLLEAIFKKQITLSSHTKELANLFITVLYGSIVTAHLEQISPIKVLFRRNIDNLLKGLS
ncbi:TetR/AcrR family transcriptional regulator [Fulvivirga sp. 29W222]|uniref:TetR/AcrR family transcriptional regulator n=1 Tax=Fulvivirga marina TaxID=2494733 RepID=A0A937KDR7_9BACT|nr:TetR/AcrR family transcriptional regulator [Fulvivirga marina]MBL6448922.1 TetR/AcrR family transcriptional regulator [Fulvivirga marina]